MSGQFHKDKKRLLLAIISLTIFLVLFTGLYLLNRTPKSRNDAVATIYPVAEFARAIAGDKMKILKIVPADVSSHDFEPDPQDILAVYSAKIFLFNGLGIDPWADKMKKELETSGIKTLNLSEKINPDKLNPHFWLDPLTAVKETEAIKDALSEIDPDNADYYAANADRYVEKLNSLDENYRNGLENCRLRTAIVSHDAFPYLGERYGISFLPILGVSSEEEPSAKEMKKLADIVKEEGMKYVFYEKLESPKPSEVIARESGAELLPLDSICGLSEESKKNGEDYISISMKNLGNLRKALECR